MVRPVLAWRAFWNLQTVYFFKFPIFVSGRGEPRIMNQWIRGHICTCEKTTVGSVTRSVFPTFDSHATEIAMRQGGCLLYLQTRAINSTEHTIIYSVSFKHWIWSHFLYVTQHRHSNLEWGTVFSYWQISTSPNSPAGIFPPHHMLQPWEWKFVIYTKDDRTA
jgi:hypothetical protein